MLNDTDEADDVGDWLRTKYPAEFGWRQDARHPHRQERRSHQERFGSRHESSPDEVDEDENPVNAIVSVLMLREGWDVQNVTVVVGLRPYNAKANILPEQTIGRGLRLMFREMPVGLQRARRHHRQR